MGDIMGNVDGRMMAKYIRENENGNKRKNTIT